MIYVLDACAIIAYLRDEEGANVIEQCLKDPEADCFVHSVNLCEVYYDFLRADGEDVAEAAIAALGRERLTERSDLDPEFWMAAGRLKGSIKRVSLADCFALSLAKRLNGTLLTSDHHELDKVSATGLHLIKFIR